MKRKLKITVQNTLEFEIIFDNNPTWYFVDWNNKELDQDGNYSIYTNQSTFGERIQIFKNKDWNLICRIGNMINGLFHTYFQISNKYPLSPAIGLDFILKNINNEVSFSN